VKVFLGRVRRVADDEDGAVAAGDFAERAALDGEDRAVGLEQVLALHALRARAGADQQRVVGVAERHFRVVGDDHAGEQREGAVFQLHDDAAHGGQRRRDVEQLQDDWLILAEQIAVGDAKQQAVADLAGSAGDGDALGGFGHGERPRFGVFGSRRVYSARAAGVNRLAILYKR